jgi:hypothetical protein
MTRLRCRASACLRRNSCAARIHQSVKYQGHYAYTHPALKITPRAMVAAVPALQRRH